MLEHVFINHNFAVYNGTSFVSVEGRVQRYSHTHLPVCIKIMKNGLFHGLTAPYLMGVSQYFYIPL